MLLNIRVTGVKHPSVDNEISPPCAIRIDFNSTVSTLRLLESTLQNPKGLTRGKNGKTLINRDLHFVAQYWSTVNHDFDKHYMITEKTALVMLDGEVPPVTLEDPYMTRQYYKSIQAFADASVKLCDENKFKKLERFLAIAYKLFKEGNETVKNGIVNVYLFSLSRSLDMHPATRKSLEPFMPKELRLEYARQRYASGI